MNVVVGQFVYYLPLLFTFEALNRRRKNVSVCYPAFRTRLQLQLSSDASTGDVKARMNLKIRKNQFFLLF